MIYNVTSWIILSKYKTIFAFFTFLDTELAYIFDILPYGGERFIYFIPWLVLKIQGISHVLT